jgi:catechol 2,3-dioxygenase-like lactoylglutathione lyase family enzyme
MLIGIDHVVLATDDPDETADALERKLGLVATGGGRHDAFGTFNRLIWLGDAFLELIGVADAGLAGRSWLGRPVLDALERGAGLVTWAIAVDDLDDALRWAPPDGPLVGPLDGERRRPDGRIVRWRLARPDPVSPTAPFLIEHDLGAAEWSAAERLARQADQHPLGGRVRLAALDIETPSPPVAAGRLRSLLAAAVQPAGRGAVAVKLGPHEARFVQPRPRPGPIVDLLADVPLRTRVMRIGDCTLRLRGSAAAPDAPVAAPAAGRGNGV